MGFSVARQPAFQSASDTLRYKHGDLIGSTQWLTDHNGAVDNPATTLAYTAFGEAVGNDSGAFSRYRYAGGHGYESDLLTLEGASGTDPLTLLHVGERWYQPEIGRFVQRDPMGIAGWINVYVYAGNCPTVGIDPGGGTPSWLAPPQTATKIVYCGITWDDFKTGNTKLHDWVARNLWQRVHSTGTLAKMSDTRMYTEAITVSVIGGVVIYFSGGKVLKVIPKSGKINSRWLGFPRWGKGWVPGFGYVWRFAAGGMGPGGSGWHCHIHRLNWWRPWLWWRMVEQKEEHPDSLSPIHARNMMLCWTEAEAPTAPRGTIGSAFGLSRKACLSPSTC